MNIKTIKLAIIDDAPILSNGLLFTLQRFSNFEVVAASTTFGELLHQMQQHPVDILLVDILRYMHNDQLVKKVKHKFPGVKVLILSMNDHDKAIVHRLLRDPHIDGYLPDKANSCDLITALQEIVLHGGYFGEEIRVDVDSGTVRSGKGDIAGLTGRELQIIRLIEQEFNNRQIADTLFISQYTVETHRKHIYQKTSTNNVIGLIKYAYSHKLVD